MRISLIVLILGLMAIVAPITLYIYQRQVHEQDVQSINGLRDQLDSTRAAHAAATTTADSARLADDIRDREYWLSRREYHVPQSQAQLGGWWRPTGFATLTVTLGAVLVVVGLVLMQRHKAGAG